MALLVASAGAGKSSALGALAQSDPTLRILTLSERASSLAGFLREFCGAFTNVTQTAAATALAKASETDDVVGYLATWLGRRLRPLELALVIDDLHRASDPAIVALLAELVADAPETLTWIFASREMPSLPFGSWLARGWMGLPIDDADLAFTVDEARDLADALGATIGDADLIALHERSDGWPIALRLALQSWNAVRDVAVLGMRTRDMLRRFADEEIFARLSAPDLALLRLAAIVPVLDAEIAFAAGHADPIAALESLADRLPLLRRDGDGWRLHDIVRELLAGRIEPGERETLARAIARSYEGRGRFAEALDLYRGIDDRDAIRAILTEHGFALAFDDGERDVVQRALPSGESTDPIFAGMAGALATTRGNMTFAEAALARGLEADDPAFRMNVVERMALIHINGTTPAIAVALIEKTLARETAPDAAARCYGLLAAAWGMLGRTEDAARAVALAVEPAPELSLRVRARIFQRAAFATFHGGDFAAAGRYAREAVRFAQEVGAESTVLTGLSVLGGVVTFVEGSLEGLAIAQELTTAADTYGDLTMRTYGLRSQYSLYAHMGDDDGMDRIDAQLAGSRERYGFRTAASVRFSRALRFAGLGRVRDAELVLTGLDLSTLSAAERVYCTATLASLAAMRGDLAAGVALVRDLPRVPEGSFEERRTGGLGHAIAALVLWRGGLHARARRIVGAIPPMHALGDRRLVAGIRDLVNIDGTIVSESAFGPFASDLADAGLAGWARFLRRVVAVAAEQRNPLSDTEAAILDAFRGGASTTEVARKLGRAEQTVSNALSRIYTKLQCTNRSQALVVAVERGYIASA